MESSELGRLLAVLISPKKTFEAIAARPTWVAILLIGALLGGAVVWITFLRVEPESLVQMVTEQNHGRELPKELTPERLHKISMISGVLGAVLIGPLVYLAFAGLLLVVLRLVGSEIGFRHSLAVTLHGMWPFSVAALLGIPVALSKDSLDIKEIQSGGFLMSHLGFLAGEETSKVVVALLNSVDLFSVWCIALLTLGFQINARVSRTTALACVAVIWALGVAIKVGMVALR